MRTALPLSPPAPRPYERDPAVRIRAMEYAAAHILLEGGATTLTHRAVAARAKVSLGSTTKYFASIEALKEAGLRVISDEIDRSLDDVEHALHRAQRSVARRGEASADLAKLMRTFLTDGDQVRASMALTTAAIADSALRSLALRWAARLTEILTPHVGADSAAALATYLDGATMHAALHDQPLPLNAIRAAVDALVAMPENWEC